MLFYVYVEKLQHFADTIELFSLFMTIDGCCTLIQFNFVAMCSKTIESLTCDQKETAERLFLHSASASSCFSNVLILSPGTDVASIVLP